jgi:hypothetical protein
LSDNWIQGATFFECSLPSLTLIVLRDNLSQPLQDISFAQAHGIATIRND